MSKATEVILKSRRALAQYGDAVLQTLPDWHKLQHLQDTLQVKCGITTVLAGGAVRDILAGRTPKDWDLLVLGKLLLPEREVSSKETPEEVMEPVLKMLAAISKYPEFTGIEISGAPNYQEQEALFWALKLHWDGLEVDLLQYRAAPEDGYAVVDLFDCTLNQVFVSVTGRVRNVTDQYPLICGVNVWFHRPGDEASDERMKYLSKKFPGLIHAKELVFDEDAPSEAKLPQAHSISGPSKPRVN